MYNLMQFINIKQLFRFNILISVFVLTAVFFFFSYSSHAQVSDTTCKNADGTPVPWYECLGGEGSEIDKSSFPVSFYQEYYIENGGDDAAYNLTVRRIIFDVFFLLISLLILGVIAIIAIATIERVLAEDSEDKLKAAKKKINAAWWAILILITFTIIGQLISVISGVGNIWDIQIFR